MKILAINGGAQKNRNTAKMLQSAFDGAVSQGGTGEIVHLYDLNYKGCVGCHACKLKGGASFGRCVQKDGLTEVLEKAIDADVLLLASPMYFNDVTGALRSFMERLFFPAITYNKERVPTYPHPIKAGWLFTMNAPGEFYESFFKGLMNSSNWILGPSEYAIAYGTKQFEDYSKYEADMFDVPTVNQRHEEQFPKDCNDAYEMGKRLATNNDIGGNI
jgi:multimeric flavodoxin WrbA